VCGLFWPSYLRGHYYRMNARCSPMPASSFSARALQSWQSTRALMLPAATGINGRALGCTRFAQVSTHARCSRPARGVLKARARPRWVCSRPASSARVACASYLHTRAAQGVSVFFSSTQRARDEPPGQRARARALLPAHYQPATSPPHARITRAHNARFIYAKGFFPPICEKHLTNPAACR